MATYDEPGYYQDATGLPPATVTGGEAIGVGDPILRDTSTGRYVRYVTGTTDDVIAGFAITACTGNGATFSAQLGQRGHVLQCSGTLTEALLGSECSLEGATSLTELNENDAANPVMRLLRVWPDANGNSDIGANSKVYCEIARWQSAPIPERPSANSQTLSANLTLTAADPVSQFLDPGGAARDVTLPVGFTGGTFRIVNTADADETLTVKNSGGTTIDTVPQNRLAFFDWNGTAWVSSGEITWG